MKAPRARIPKCGARLQQAHSSITPGRGFGRHRPVPISASPSRSLCTPSKVPAHLAADLWRAFNIGLVLISVLLLARMLSIPVLTFEFAVLAVAAFSFFPIHESIFLGQITICLLALWTVGIVAYFDDLIVLSAAAFAVATVFKVTPVLVVPLFLIWKDRRWLVSYLGILLGLVAAMAAINGFQVLSIYPSVMSSMGGGIPAMANKSLSSLVAWMFYGKVFTMDSVLDVTANPLRSISVVSKILSGLFYSTCLFSCGAAATSIANRRLLSSLCLPSLLLASPQ